MSDQLENNDGASPQPGKGRPSNSEIAAPFRAKIEDLEAQLALLGGQFEALPWVGSPNLRESVGNSGAAYRRELAFVHGEDTGSSSVVAWISGFSKRVEEAFTHGVIAFPECEPGRVPKVTFTVVMETVLEAEAVLSTAPVQ